MAELHIGAGGWAYFKVPGMSPLEAYSRAFDFVEVNSTFYELPGIGRAEGWRRAVPPRFRFAVRANRAITHDEPFSLSPRAEGALERTLGVCRALRADALHFLAPPDFAMSRRELRRLNDFFSSFERGPALLAVEARGRLGDGDCCSRERALEGLGKVLRDHDVVHCVDLLKGETPAWRSETLYTRIFGRGERNIYQPDDREVELIDRASADHQRAYISFHGVRMYSDAARMVEYSRSGIHPPATGARGAESFRAVLAEDAVFPMTKADLIVDQGWKLFDGAGGKKVRVAEVLERLPEGVYRGVAEVIDALQAVGIAFG